MTAKRRPSKEERIGNLALLLISSKEPLSWLQIFGRMRNYYGDNDKIALRTFERDKQVLRKMGIEVEAVKLWGEYAQVGYRIHPERAQLSPLPLSDSEIDYLLLVNGVFRHSQWLPFKDRLLSLQAKAFWQKGGRARQEGKAFLRVTAPLSLVDTQLLETVETALWRRKELIVSAKKKRMRVYPFGLLFRGGIAYLIGKEIGKKKYCVLPLHQVERAQMQANPEVPDFDPPEDLDIETLWCIRPWAGKGEGKVCLEWQCEGKRARRESVFVKDKEKFFRYLLRFRAQVRIVSPSKMRHEFRAYLRALAEVYN